MKIDSVTKQIQQTEFQTLVSTSHSKACEIEFSTLVHCNSYEHSVDRMRFPIDDARILVRTLASEKALYMTR